VIILIDTYEAQTRVMSDIDTYNYTKLCDFSNY